MPTNSELTWKKLYSKETKDFDFISDEEEFVADLIEVDTNKDMNGSCLPKDDIRKIVINHRQQEELHNSAFWGVFPDENLTFPPKVPYRHKDPRQGRNSRCGCGSGRKFKSCCMGKSVSTGDN